MGHKKRRNVIRKQGLPPGTLVYTGDRAAMPAEVHTLYFGDGNCEVQDRYPLPGEREKNPSPVWVDVRNLADTSFIQRVGDDFEIHPLALEDVLNTQQRAKLDEYDNGLFLVIPSLRFDPVTVEFSHEQIALFVRSDAVVSFQEDPDDTFATVRQRMVDGVGKLRRKGPDYLAYALTDMIVDGYFMVLDQIEVAMLEVENGLYSDADERHCKTRIFQLKYAIGQFRNRVQPLRDAIARLIRIESELIDETNLPYLRDLADHIAQVLDSADNYRELLANLEALYQAEISNRMNSVMKLLTVISTIFIPLSFIAGVYGMNFDHMPELHWRYGYFIVLGFMFSVMIGMLIYFRRKRWI